MVIRGKRVNRCDTCTRRKVKCDEGQPECGRCKRAGLKCEGYTAKLVYVPVNDATTSSHARCDLASNATHKPVNLGIRQQGRQSIHSQRLEKQPMPNIRIRSLLPDENTILSSHILSRFNPSSQAEPSAPGTLLTKIIEMDTSYSAQALTAIYFGKMRNQYEMYQKGQRFYGAALTQLQKWLLDPQEARKNDVLTSVLCLCLYEHVVLSEETAWLKHYEGIARLVEHRGPASFQTKFERDVFQLCRCMIIKAAGVTKSHCFLAQDRWKVGRRSSDYDHQQVIDSMYDTMAEVPGLFHEIDRLTFVDKTTESPSYLALRDQLEYLLNELYNYPRALRMASDIEEDRNEILPPQNQAVAAGVAMCHASILCLALATDYFDLPLQVPGFKEASDIDTRDRAYKANVRRTLACEIFHLAAATLRGEQSTSDAFSFIFSLQVAHEHLPPDTLEGIRLEGLLDDVIAGKHGFETGRTRRWAAYFNSPPQLGQ